VIEQRGIIRNKVLVEGKSTGYHGWRYCCANAINAVSDFVDSCAVILIAFHFSGCSLILMKQEIYLAL
jgi:hypothetical protein